MIDGQLIYHSGKGYLRRAAYDDEQASGMMKLTAVLFHLVVLGLLAIVSIIEVDTGDAVKNVVLKLGVVLLLLAAGSRRDDGDPGQDSGSPDAAAARGPDGRGTPHLRRAARGTSGTRWRTAARAKDRVALLTHVVGSHGVQCLPLTGAE